MIKEIKNHKDLKALIFHNVKMINNALIDDNAVANFNEIKQNILKNKEVLLKINEMEKTLFLPESEVFKNLNDSKLCKDKEINLINNYSPENYIDSNYKGFDLYIKDLLIYSVKLLSNFHDWFEEKEYKMCAYVLSDALDIFEVAYFLYNDLPSKAYSKADILDTYIRDGFAKDFWENFIVKNNINELIKYEKIKDFKSNLDLSLNNKETDKKRMKV